MSLIQQALEKTNRAQETRTTTPAPSVKPWSRDPMGAKLEQDLIRIQQEYVRRRKLYWKIALGVLLVSFVAGLLYVAGVREVPFAEKKAPTAVAVPVVARSAAPSQLRIYSGNIFRLTGIMDLGRSPMAMINGKILGVGDSLEGKAVVKTIGKGEVLLDVGGKELRLTL